MPGPTAVAVSALARASRLLEVLDREHTNAEVHQHARAVRQEVRAALEALGGAPPELAASPAARGEQTAMDF